MNLMYLKGYEGVYVMDTDTLNVYKTRATKESRPIYSDQESILNSLAFKLALGDGNKLRLVDIDTDEAKLVPLEQLMEDLDPEYCPIRNVFRCEELDAYYSTGKTAAKHLNVSDSYFYNAYNRWKNDKHSGPTFLIRNVNIYPYKGPVPTAKLDPEGVAFDTKLLVEPPSASKRIVCSETGQSWNSIKEAAKDVGCNNGYLGQLIKKGLPYKGKFYRIESSDKRGV